MFMQRALCGRTRPFEITKSRHQHASAARANGEHPRAVEPITVAFKRIDDVLCVIESSESNHRFGRIRNEGCGDDLRRIRNVFEHGE
jgi:hypothetical protein